METTELTDSPWSQGGKIARRYTLSKMILAKPEQVIWKAMDEKLNIECFILMSITISRVELRQIAWNMICHESEPGCPVVYGMYRAADQDIIIFSYDAEQSVETVIAKWLKPWRQKPEAIEKMSSSLRPEMEKRILPSGTILNRRYEIIAPLGIGGFGVTYLCIDRILLRNVAIKEYFPESYASRDGKYVMVASAQALDAFRGGYRLFWQEILLTVRLNPQKNLPTVYDVFEENETAYMVMRYESGESVGREYRARSYIAYTPKRMCELILPMLEGLQYLHKYNILHCDISPANIIHRNDGEIVLIDLGSAMDMADKEAVYNVAVLKKDFAAPEQFINAKAGHMVKKIGAWTDIYAVGATMYYLLTGEKADDAVTRMETKKKLQLPAEFDGKLKKGWFKLVQQCMELEPEKRVKSVEELSRQITKLLKKEK